MSKKLLLTGIGGSIGIHVLIHIMHHTDYEVIGIDSFRHKGLTDRIAEEQKAHPEWNHRYKIFTHDLSAPFSPLLKKKIGKVDYIINMASLSDVEASLHDPVNFFQNNVSLVLNMLELSKDVLNYKYETYEDEGIVKKVIGYEGAFIQISTDEVYGPTTGKNDGYEEWSTMLPSNPYAASKAAQEMACIAWWRSYGIPLIITNTMNNFGEMQSPSKYPVMIQKAIANGEKITIHGIRDEIGSRSYIHSRNFADALLFLLKNVEPHIHEPGKVDRPDRFHIAGDKQVDNLELVQLVAKLMGKTEELDYELVDVHSTRPGHDPHYGLKAEKIKALGWTAPVSFEDSLANTIKWQTEHEDWIN